MGIERRGPNSWRVGQQVSTPEGWKWIRRSFSYPASMSEAEQTKAIKKEEARLIMDIEKGQALPTSQHTVRSFAEMYMRDHVEPNTSENHRSTCQHFLDKHILPELGDLKLEKVTPMHITKFLNKLKATPKQTTRKAPGERKTKPSPTDIARYGTDSDEPRYLSGRTVHHYYQFLKTMFAKAVQWEHLARTPMDRVDPPKYRKKKVKALTDPQAVALLRLVMQEPNQSFRAAVLLAVTCGLRLGEVGALNWMRDVDWDSSQIDITRARKYTPLKGTFEGPPKSEAGERAITLPAGMLDMLREIRADHLSTAQLIGDRWRGDGTIVCDWDGSPLHHDTPSKWFRVFADRNGYSETVFHHLRHTHASMLFEAGVNPISVADRLGHEDPHVTLRVYGHLVQPRDEKSPAAMQDLLDRAALPPSTKD